MKKIALLFSALLLILSNSNVSCDTIYVNVPASSGSAYIAGMAYDGCFCLKGNSAGDIYSIGRTAFASSLRLATNVPHNPFVIYGTKTMVLDLQNGKYQIWAITSNSVLKNSAPEPDLGKTSNNMFYFHPDPLLYIKHTGELEKLYRYVIFLLLEH